MHDNRLIRRNDGVLSDWAQGRKNEMRGKEISKKNTVESREDTCLGLTGEDCQCEKRHPVAITMRGMLNTAARMEILFEATCLYQ